MLEDTLYVPIRGRLFCSKKYPAVFYDSKTLDIVKSLPIENLNIDDKNEYFFMATAVRSKNTDYYVKDFLKKHPEGSIINIGCGLDTVFYRNDNGKCTFFEIDLEDVINLRNDIFENDKRDISLTFSMFDYKWIEEVKKHSSGPYLLLANGLFYYFKEFQVLDFLKNIKKLGNVEIVFDAVSKTGLKATKECMKQLGHKAVSVYFYVDDINQLLEKIGDVKLIDDSDFYKHIKNKDIFQFKTKTYMLASDKFHMLRMICLKYE